MSIIEDIFGLFSKDEVSIPVKRYTLQNSSGIKLQVTDYGANISDIVVPDNTGQPDHVVLGFDDISGYHQFRFIGSTIGRVANRIKDGKFKIGENDYQLTINNNENHLHGGEKGWDTCLWTSVVVEDRVVFSLTSPDCSEGYPGLVLAQVAYSLSEDGSISIDYQAMANKPTPINMTNHSFFNLAGHGSGQAGIMEHQMQLFCDRYISIDEKLIPTGAIQPVENSSFDLQEMQPLKISMAHTQDKGFDHCFCVRNNRRGELSLAVKAVHPPSGRFLEVYTTEPGVQLYTGNFLPTETKEMVGKDGTSYTYQGAFCCEPQNYPNAVNEASFPNSILRPGEVYKHKIVYRLGTQQH